jgi:hypothetical protein
MGFWSKLFGKKEEEAVRETEVKPVQTSFSGGTSQDSDTQKEEKNGTSTQKTADTSKADTSSRTDTATKDAKPAPSGITTATPLAKQAEKSVDKAVSKPTEKTVDKTVEKPASEAVSKPAEKTVDKPASKAVSKPAEKANKKPAGKSNTSSSRASAASLVATTPENPTEKWITASVAVGTVYSGGDWHYFGGCKEVTAQKQAEAKQILQNEWSVKDKESLMEMAEWLTSFYESERCNSSDAKTGGWDLCRGCEVLTLGYIAGYLTKGEMVFSSVKICQTMQYWYHSWKELFDSYIEGYHDWRGNQGGNIHGDVAQREQAYAKLMQEKDNPSEISWGMKLTGTM